MKKRKKVLGFSLVEILIAIVVIGILVGLSIVAGASAQEKARLTTAGTALEDYKSAFTSSVLQHPGAIDYRADAWLEAEDSGETYTTKSGLEKLVKYMNASLEDRLKFSWDDELKAYVSAGDDPWGGKYILTEYPEGATESYFNPIENSSALYCSIWATGRDETITSDKTICDKCVGFGIRFKDGVVTHWYHGVNGEELPYTDCTIPMG